MKKKQSAKPRRSLLWGAAAAVAFALLAGAWGKSNQASAPVLRAHVRRAARGAAAVRAGEPAPAAAARKSYQVVVSRNLFLPSGAVAPQQQGAVSPMPIEALNVVQTGPAEAMQPQWTYAGYATVDARPLAIIENTTTKRAEFVAVGDRVEGMTVGEITPTTVKLSGSGRDMTLALSSAFTATPLNEPPRPTRAAASQQGRRGGLMQSGLFQQVILPAIQSNPQYAEEARQIMSGFGRGGRGRFGGGQPPIPGGGFPGGPPQGGDQ